MTYCSQRGNWRKALELFAGMEAEGVQPDLVTYNVALDACAKDGQWRLGMELMAKVC